MRKIINYIKVLFKIKELSTTQKLNKLFHKHYSNLFKELKKKHLIECEKGPGNLYNIPFFAFDGEGMTIQEDNNCGAFSLEPASAFRVSTGTPKQIIQRIMFSYEFCESIAKDEKQFKKIFDKLVPYLISRVEKQIYQPLGPVPVGKKVFGSIYVTAQMPGRGLEYFLEMYSSAGYELRLYSDIAKVDYETLLKKPF